MWSKALFSWQQGGMIILNGSNLTRWAFERDWAFRRERDFNSSWIYNCFAGFSLSDCYGQQLPSCPWGSSWLVIFPSWRLDLRIWGSLSQPAQLHKPCNTSIRIDISYWFMLLWLNPDWHNHFPESKLGEAMNHFPFSISSTVKDQGAECEHQNAVGSFYSQEFCAIQSPRTLN